MPASDASCTSATTQTRRSRGPRVDQLKIMQEQVGHRFASTLGVYTHVSQDYMNTMMAGALEAAFVSEAPQVVGVGGPAAAGSRSW